MFYAEAFAVFARRSASAPPLSLLVMDKQYEIDSCKSDPTASYERMGMSRRYCAEHSATGAIIDALSAQYELTHNAVNEIQSSLTWITRRLDQLVDRD